MEAEAEKGAVPGLEDPAQGPEGDGKVEIWEARDEERKGFERE